VKEAIAMGIESDVELNVQSDVIFHHIVVPHDLTARSDRALELAATMAHPLRSEIILINVIDPDNPREEEGMNFMSRLGDISRDRWRFLKLRAKRVLPSNLKSDVRIFSGNPQDVILSEAQKLGADLLVITTHPVTGAGYPFSGGKTEQIFLQDSCPVLTFQVSLDDEKSRAEMEMKKLQTHSLKQYCDVSRQLAKTSIRRPVFLGYAQLPANPAGVCE